ncbi:MAG: ISL3 family transposase [Bacillota bacterium]
MQKLIPELFELQGFVVYGLSVNEAEVCVKVGRPKKEARCPHCGSLTRRVHARPVEWQRKFHGVLDGRRVYLMVRPRRFWCPYCSRAFTESVPGVAKWARRTDRGEMALLSELKASSFLGVARRIGVGYKGLCRALFRRVSGQVDISVALAGLERVVLGVDEHSFRGQDLMITVTCLWPTRVVLAILRDDRASTLRAFLRGLPVEVRSKIIGVCIDMKASFLKAVRQELPKAIVVSDRFHVMQDANRRVDEARRVEQEITRETIPRWPLVKNEFDLSERQAAALADIRRRHKNVAHFHWVKEQLRDVYEAPTKEEARRILERVVLNCEAGSDAAMVQWGRTLKTWRDPILAYHDLRVTNGYTEGVHTKVKLIKRLSYGFRNPEVYVRKMLLALLPLGLLLRPPH